MPENEPVDPVVRSAYAGAVADGQTKGPEEFANQLRAAADDAGIDTPAEWNDLHVHLPPHEAFTDAARQLTEQVYKQAAPDTVAVTRANLTEEYEAGGTHPQVLADRAAFDSQLAGDLALPRHMPSAPESAIKTLGLNSIYGTLTAPARAIVAATKWLFPGGEESAAAQIHKISKEEDKFFAEEEAKGEPLNRSFDKWMRLHPPSTQLSNPVLWALMPGNTGKMGEDYLASEAAKRQAEKAGLAREDFSVMEGGQSTYDPDTLRRMRAATKFPEGPTEQLELPLGGPPRPPAQLNLRLGGEEAVYAPQEYNIIGQREAVEPQPEPQQPRYRQGLLFPQREPQQGDLFRQAENEPEPESEPSPLQGVYKESAEVKAFRRATMLDVGDTLFAHANQISMLHHDFIKELPLLPKLSSEEVAHIEAYYEYHSRPITTEKGTLEWKPPKDREPPVLTPREKEIVDSEEAVRTRAAKNFAYLESNGMLEDVPADYLADLKSGYLHRITLGHAEFSPEQVTSPIGGRGLRRTTSAQKERVASLAGLTMREIEERTDIRYLHNPVFANHYVDLQLQIARLNHELLFNKALPLLEERGLMTRDAAEAQRLGFQETQIPALRGHWFEPRQTNSFDDFYRRPSVFSGAVADAIAPWADAVHHSILNIMFIDPRWHMLNVTGDWFVGRGGKWASPRGYWDLADTGIQALREVLTQGPIYREIMRHGGSLKSMTLGNQNILSLIVQKFGAEIGREPSVWESLAKASGFNTVKDMLKKIYSISPTVMWGYHDLLYLQHVLELQKRGYELPAAIRKTNEYLAPYRIPAELIVSPSNRLNRAASVLMQDPVFSFFGRYHYHMAQAMTRLVTQLAAGPNKSQAAARLMLMYLTLTVGNSVFNYLSKKASGNDKAYWRAPGVIELTQEAVETARDLLDYNNPQSQPAYRFKKFLSHIVMESPIAKIAALPIEWLADSAFRQGHTYALPFSAQAKLKGAQLVRGAFPWARQIEDLYAGAPGAKANLIWNGLIKVPPNYTVRPPSAHETLQEWRRYHTVLHSQGLE